MSNTNCDEENKNIDSKKKVEHTEKQGMNSDRMTPIPFEKMLLGLMSEYKSKKSFFDVPVCRNTEKGYKNDIGPAAGPHTQLAGNLIAGYGAGASYFELKTVQVMTGEELGISKPCIYAATEVFNTEWSTELSIEEAKSEYIKAYLLLKILIREFELGDPDSFEFVMSAGYDLKGIQSPLIDGFIEHMKDASSSNEWIRDMEFLYDYLHLFEKIDKEYLSSFSPRISDTIALSTMHGCKRDEIEKIAAYLLCEKQLNVYVKMNPTLLGIEAVRNALDSLSYQHLEFDPHSFEADIDFESACEMLERLQKTAEKEGKRFGVKVTNTLPVSSKRGELKGDTMYLSGPALYPIAMGVAGKLADKFKGKLPISYSGGADAKNISKILACGIRPVTVSSYLLRPSGYKNIKMLAKAVENVVIPKRINVENVKDLAKEAILAEAYQYKERRLYVKADDYSVLCASCHNCVDICPNRANRRITVNGTEVVIHLDQLCNECGTCSFYCIKGYDPYRNKLTIYNTKEDFDTSTHPGVFADEKVHIKNIEIEKENENSINIIREYKWEEFI